MWIRFLIKIKKEKKNRKLSLVNILLLLLFHVLYIIRYFTKYKGKLAHI